ncbi:MAG TPA: hypothetical protein VJ486_10620 [Geothrix sp.]|nr:hypothetical protein [Geothrix sp.]
MQWKQWHLGCSLLTLALAFGCGGGGSKSNPPPTPVSLDPSGIFQGSMISTSFAPVDITEGIILPTGEARLLLRSGYQISANLQITNNTFNSSALEYTTSSQQSITISDGKINSSATSGGQANLNGSYNTFNDNGQFTLYSIAPLNSSSSPKSLNNLAGTWIADAVTSAGYILININSSGNITPTSQFGGQFTQITPNNNGFRVSISINGLSYTGLAYTFGNSQFADTFLVILASTTNGQFYAVFHH